MTKLPMIEVRDLVKRYGDVIAVDGLSFTVETGETFALIGPNGAGKTTTLKLLLGLVRPDRGTIAIGPQRLRPEDPRARHQLGYVPQRVEFSPSRTVTEVLEFFSDLRGLPRSAVGLALERAGLTALASRKASELSGGYTQRLSLAQAVLGDPALLVLDEPTASLDPEATWEFRTLTQQLQREGVTVLLCSHLLAEVERIADRVLILSEGRSAVIERMDALRARQAGATRLAIDVPEARAAAAAAALEQRGIVVHAVDDRRLALDGANGNGPLALETLRAAGIEVLSFELQKPTLEEIFLEVVRGRPR
jgi:Cu-processing system ATP-binding protein